MTNIDHWCKQQQFLFLLVLRFIQGNIFLFCIRELHQRFVSRCLGSGHREGLRSENPRGFPVFRVTGSYTQYPGESEQLPGESAGLCPCASSRLPRHEIRRAWLAAGVQWLLEPLPGRGSERAEVWRRFSGVTSEALVGADLLVQTAPVDGPRFPRSVVPWRNWTATCGRMV